VSVLISCDEHGEDEATYVCSHIAKTLKDKKPRGFLDLIDEHGEHSAICTACNTIPFKRWQKTGPKNMKVICWGCYKRAALVNGIKLTGTRRTKH
jgi:hypothetical protein